MLREFTLNRVNMSIRAYATDRMASVRVVAPGRGSVVVCATPHMLTARRTYAYPPPPPPNNNSYGYGPQGAPFPPQPQPYYAMPTQWAMPAPMPPPQAGPQLGTKERPVVIVAAPQKMSWWSRLSLFVLLSIALLLMFSVFDELQSRFQGPTSGSRGGSLGGRSGVAQMFGSHEAQKVNLDDLEVTFEGIRGCDEAKKELEEIVDFLKDPEKFKAMGGRLPKGALLVGPPGCGKTLLAKAIAKEAGVSFFYATGSEFDEMFVGVGARRVRDLFAAAKANSPALIFIDEIDALAGKRTGVDQSHSRMTLNQLLAEMDGFQSSEGVLVLAATNTPETLDKALTRPGRLDTTITVDPPDMRGRAEVLQVYLDRIRRDSTVDATEIARGTTGFTGAELSNLVNIAALRAAVLNKASVTRDEIEYAKDRVMMGAESRKVIPEEERRVTAFHEGAHALMAMLLRDQGADPVHKATIVPRGSGIMGLVQQLPEKDKYSQSKRQCLARLKVCLAGRVGEELLLGPDDVTTGASSDFQQATSMARGMVRRFGFSDAMGVVDYSTADTADGAYMSDETKRRIESEVSTLLRDAYNDTRATLVEHRAELEALAEGLLKYETLNGDDLAKILKGEPLPARPPRIPPPSASSSTVDSKKGGGGSGGSGGSGSGSNRQPNTIPIS